MLIFLLATEHLIFLGNFPELWVKTGSEATGVEAGQQASVEGWPGMEAVGIEASRSEVGSGARAEGSYRCEGQGSRSERN